MKREFIRHSRTWYRTNENYTDEIMLLCEEGAEVMIRWYDIRNIEDAPRIEAFNDGWPALFQVWAPMLSKIGTGDMSPDDMEAFLISEGVEDVTPVESPYA